MINDDFKEIFDKYESEKRKPLKGNKFAAKMRNEFNDNLTELLSEFISEGYELETKISHGQGNWVKMPWADARYTRVSDGFQQGFYIYSWFDLENKILNMGVIQGNNKTSEDLLKSRFDYLYEKFLEKFPQLSDSETGDYFIKLNSLSYDDLSETNLRQAFKELIEIYESLIPDYIECVCNEEPSEEELRPQDVVSIWRIAPGPSNIINDVWEDFKKDSYVGVGFERENYCPNFNELKNIYAVNNFLNGCIFETTKSSWMIWKYVKWIHKGDIVIVNKGRSKLAGIGIVTSEFIPKCKNNNLKKFGLNNIRNVKWLFTPNDLEIKKNIFQRDTLEEWTNHPEKWNELIFVLSGTDTELKGRLLEHIYSLFWNDYLNTEEGKIHLYHYSSEEEYIKNTWEEITQKYESGKNISDDIWEKILARDNKLHNDAVNDIKGSIKNKRAYSDEDMNNVAILFYETINRLLTCGNVEEEKQILEEYANNKYSREFGTGRLSPILHYLNDSYYVINNKTLTTVELFSLVLGERLELDSNIKNYISNNSKLKNFLLELNEIYSYANFNIDDFHVFDIFCHWLNDKRLGNFIGKDSNLIPLDLILPNADSCESCNSFYEYLQCKGYYFDKETIENYLLSLKVKPFVILTGNSGTGKTKLAQLFAQYLNKKENYKIIPVGANWTENRHILGYFNILKNKPQYTPAYNLIKKSKDASYPHFLILDEMNLSHVERYFADFLSAIESKEPIPLHNNTVLEIPENLYIIGTVNVDETTYMFSPKVLDRANTIEFKTYSAKDYLTNKFQIEKPLGDLNYLEDVFEDHELKDKNIQELNKIFNNEKFWEELSNELFNFQEILKKSGFDFGFRVINEIVRFMAAAYKYENSPENWTNWKRYFDAQIKQKMLPKLHGSQKIIGETLDELIEACQDYPMSKEKLDEMKNVLSKQRYVSFIN